MKGLGFESYVCQLCVLVLLLIFNNMYEHGIGNVTLYWWECITKHDMVGWLCIELNIGMVWVQTLVNPNLTSFLLNTSCGFNVKRQRKPSRRENNKG